MKRTTEEKLAILRQKAMQDMALRATVVGASRAVVTDHTATESKYTGPRKALTAVKRDKPYGKTDPARYAALVKQFS